MDKIGFKTSSKEDAYEGKTFEDYDHKIKLFGRTEHMTSVIFDGNIKNVGKIVQVEVVSSSQTSLFGKIKENYNKKVA